MPGRWQAIIQEDQVEPARRQGIQRSRGRRGRQHCITSGERGGYSRSHPGVIVYDKDGARRTHQPSFPIF